MNITIGNNSKHNVLQVPTRYIAGVTGVALALSAVFAFSPAKGNNSAIVPAPSAAAAATRYAAPESPLRVVVVASEQSKTLLEAQFAADTHVIAALGQPLPAQLFVVVKGSALEQAVISASGDVAGSGTSVSVVDLTAPPLTATSALPAVQPMFGTAADAEHAAQSLVPVTPITTTGALSSDESIEDYAAREQTQIELSRSRASVAPMFGRAADAEYAAQSLVPVAPLARPQAVQPMFGTAADAEHAAQSLVPVAPLARPVAVQPMFGTAADAEHAAQSLVPVAPLARPVAIQPMFGTEADAEFAARGLNP